MLYDTPPRLKSGANGVSAKSDKGRALAMFSNKRLFPVGFSRLLICHLL